MDDSRPDPDALLAGIRRQDEQSRRGKLKIFFGMCPGVGKTYAMLLAARQRRAEGVEVLIGLVETHGRKETIALLQGKIWNRLLPFVREEHPRAGREALWSAAALRRFGVTHGKHCPLCDPAKPCLKVFSVERGVVVPAKHTAKAAEDRTHSKALRALPSNARQTAHVGRVGAWRSHPYFILGVLGAGSFRFLTFAIIYG